MDYFYDDTSFSGITHFVIKVQEIFVKEYLFAPSYYQVGHFPGVEIMARNWKLPERFSDLPTRKHQKLPAHEEISELLSYHFVI